MLKQFVLSGPFSVRDENCPKVNLEEIKNKIPLLKFVVAQYIATKFWRRSFTFKN